MNGDFEVHPRGTAEELRRSRELATVIDQLIVQYGEGIIPKSILDKYKPLRLMYQRHITSEEC